MTLTAAASLLNELRERGVHLEAVGECLRFHPQEAVTSGLRERLTSCKRALFALLREEALIADGGVGESPCIGRCRSCREGDFVRPRAGGAWRCTRCRPYDLPAAEVEWWPRVESATPFAAGMFDRRESGPDPSARPCHCCGCENLWRLRPSGTWICSRCHSPTGPASEVEMITAKGGER